MLTEKHVKGKQKDLLKNVIDAFTSMDQKC